MGEKDIQDQFFDIIEFLPDATFVIDSNRKVIAWNKAIEEMTGVAKSEVIGKGDYAYAVPFYGDRRPVLVDLIFKSSREIESKYDYLKREGNVLYTEVFLPSLNHGKGIFVWAKASPLYDRSGNLTGAIESIRDITEQKLAKENLGKLNEELTKSNRIFKQLALKDSHTGLYNHRYLGEVIEAEFFRAKRYAHPLSAILTDIDYFKSINDVYGHQFGDVILKQFARQLKMAVRQYDIVVRTGGEEFVVLSPATDRADAVALAERILEVISLYDFGDESHKVKLKISVAVASYPEDKISKGMDLIDLADHILVKVKDFGGNRVYSSSDLKRQDKGSSPGETEKMADVKSLKKELEKLTRQANQGLIESIFAFAKTIELKDHYTGEHVEKTVHYATEVARELNLPNDEVDKIRKASILHDLGKIGISENILLKKGKLTKKEFDEIRKHPQIAVDILRPIQSLQGVIPMIYYHHERWDGGGYLNGLKGDEIPIGARIIAVSDVYEALTSDRPYRKAFSRDEAIKMVRESSGTQFDPKVVDAFLKVLQQEK
ncbi:MAG: diguanylate cyclase [Candidatus Omnitrophica bacterium]|nr:diguanylate cyclase [Candidatus Omnitrophota bacterium]MDD5311237.1 diguanylate cyclase [Candidatus Omnitrophota bacterium]MDD5545730.1 diguanylate cyclase [Candidatus Omnitrophota bacterium]